MGESASHRGFPLDRSKVRILLCDKDAKSSDEVLQLLYKCSYQVIPVRTARQVIEVLNAQGPDIDIILAEVDLPIAKGLKMLKYIMRDKELRRIPIIMMSAQDDVSVVVKCLRLGAADYLVKPLRTNELLNLWTHMWRRRRMLGLAEKDVFGHDLEFVMSDSNDASTNSSNLLSNDTEDKPTWSTHPGTSVSDHHEYEFNASAMEPAHKNPLENKHNIQENAEHRVFSGGFFSCPKKTDLRVGECSAFLTYVKSSAPIGYSQFHHIDRSATPSEPSQKIPPVSSDTCEIGLVTSENAHHTNHAFPMPMEFPLVCFSSSETQPQSRIEVHVDVAGVPPSIFRLPSVYVPVMAEQNISPLSSVQLFKNDVQVHTTASTMLPQYNVLPTQFSHVPMMPPFPYHPAGIHLQSGHIPPPPHLMWPSMTSASAPEVKPDHSTERRAAALIKFRQKRKDRCFDKKIRYVNRKHLAETRPRIRGQFVRRQADGLDGDIEEDEGEELVSRESEFGYSENCNASV